MDPSAPAISNATNSTPGGSNQTTVLAIYDHETMTLMSSIYFGFILLLLAITQYAHGASEVYADAAHTFYSDGRRYEWLRLSWESILQVASEIIDLCQTVA